MAEAVVVLPVMLILYTALLHMGQAGHARQLLRDEVRLQTWQQAMDGCPQAADSGGLDRELSTQAADAMPDTGGADGHQAQADLSYVQERLDDLLGDAIRIERSGDLAVPSLLGGTKRTFKEHFTLMCNPTGLSGSEIAKDNFHRSYDSHKEAAE